MVRWPPLESETGMVIWKSGLKPVPVSASYIDIELVRGVVGARCRAETAWLDFRLALSWARVVASAVPPTEPTLIELQPVQVRRVGD